MSKKVYPKEIGINGIDQDIGVTPEQIVDYLRQLIYLSQPLFRMVINLTNVETNEAINEATLRVYEKMQAGVVPNKDFQEFKSYLFITFKHEIEKQFIKRKAHKTNIILKAANYEDVIPEDYQVIDPYEAEDSRIPEYKALLERGINMLTPSQKEVVKLYLQGNGVVKTSRMMGKSKNYVNSIMVKLRNIVKKLNANPDYKFRPIKK